VAADLVAVVAGILAIFSLNQVAGDMWSWSFSYGSQLSAAAVVPYFVGGGAAVVVAVAMLVLRRRPRVSACLFVALLIALLVALVGGVATMVSAHPSFYYEHEVGVLVRWTLLSEVPIVAAIALLLASVRRSARGRHGDVRQ